MFLLFVTDVRSGSFVTGYICLTRVGTRPSHQWTLGAFPQNTKT